MYTQSSWWDVVSKGKLKIATQNIEENMVPGLKPTHYGFGNTRWPRLALTSRYWEHVLCQWLKHQTCFSLWIIQFLTSNMFMRFLNSWDEHMEKVCPHLKLPWGNCFFQIPNLCILNIFNILILFKTPLLRLLLTYIRPYLIPHAS